MNYSNDLKKSIYSFFENNKNKKYALNELIELFGITEKEQEIFFSTLIKLRLEKKLILKDNYIMIFPLNPNLRIGKLKSKDNDYYINLGNRKIYIPNDCLNGAISGDNILYEIKFDIDKECFAEVKDIIYRQRKKIIFDCKVYDGKTILIPYSTGFNYKINLSSDDFNKIKDGERVLIKIYDFSDKGYNGKIIDHIGYKDDPDLFIKTFASENGIKISYPKEVLEEVNTLPQTVSKEAIKNRTDYRNKLVFTVDGRDTKDMDDAISLEMNEKGNFVLGVYISDVANYVKYGSAIYIEAKRRGNSCYPSDAALHMLPPILSNGICSLNEGADRLSLSCVMEIDRTGEVVSYKIEESVINSKKKMTYEDVNNVLNGTMIPGYEKFYDTLKQLEILSNILEKRKQNRQCINIFDNSVLTGIKQEQAYVKPLNKGKSQKILENCMLIFNETVAKYSFKSLLPFIYRCEEKPDAKKLEEIVLELKNLGYDFKVNRAFDDEYYLYDMLQQIEKYPEYPILSMKIIQGLKKAFYTPNNIGHFGLVLFFYTHFSAPIRRFPDLQNQILIKNYIKGQYPENIDKLNKELEEISEHCNFTSKLSDTLERYIDNKIIKIYMEQHSQDIFNVTICCITRNTITVKTDNGIYGKINVEDLNEIYKYNKDKKILYNDKEILKIGTKIDVILKKIEGDKIKFKSPTTSIVRVRK